MSSTAQNQMIKENLWENHYPMKKFLFQLGFLLFTLCIWGLLIVHTLKSESSPLSVVLGFVIAQFLVDWVSGMLHWACDTWGQFTTPIVGPTLIRSFRMHHLDPQDITKHGFIETNASSCYPMPLFIFVGLQINPQSFFIQTYEWTIIFGVILGILTNEFHKWAHMVHSKAHPIIRFLQNSRLILNHEEHHRHHQGQFDRAYCIINGWMNPFLQKIDYWRRMEKLITKITGAAPRADDNFWRKAKCLD